MTKAKIDARPVLHIPYIKIDLWLVDFSGAPFVPLQPVCDVLGLNFRKQVDRLRNSKKPYGIKSVAATEGEKLLHLSAIPLENLSAFLFTLKPNIPNLVILRNFQRTVARSLTFFWSRYQREYCMPKTVAIELAMQAKLAQSKGELDPPHLSAAPTPTPARCERVTPEVVAKIKEMKDGGMNVTAISKKIGCSRSTASLILSGKYKTIASGTLPLSATHH